MNLTRVLNYKGAEFIFAVLQRFAFRHQDVFFSEFVKKGLKFHNQSEIASYTV